MHQPNLTSEELADIEAQIKRLEDAQNDRGLLCHHEGVLYPCNLQKNQILLAL
jgi:hypothetical protein